MAEIFISYSQQDKAKVRPIAESLEAEGFDVFWDPEIPPGETWDNVIARELKSARCVIVAWSETSAASDWVKEEAEYGKRMKALVPVQIDPSGPPLGFSRIQTANLSQWDGDPGHPEWRKVLDRVRHHGADTSAAPPTPEPETREAKRLRDALYEDEATASAPPQPAQPPVQPHVQSGPVHRAGASDAAPQARFASGPASQGGKSGQRFDFPYIFFSLQGRLSRKPFWIGVAILFAVQFVSGFVFAMVPAATFLISLVLIYPSLCLYGKRLHDFGQTAWIYGGYLIASFMLGAVIGGVMGASGAYPEEIMMTTGLLSFVLTVAITLWIGLMASQPRDNKYGPAPDGAGIAEAFS